MIYVNEFDLHIWSLYSKYINCHYRQRIVARCAQWCNKSGFPVGAMKIHRFIPVIRRKIRSVYIESLFSMTIISWRICCGWNFASFVWRHHVSINQYSTDTLKCRSSPLPGYATFEFCPQHCKTHPIFIAELCASSVACRRKKRL